MFMRFVSVRVLSPSSGTYYAQSLVTAPGLYEFTVHCPPSSVRGRLETGHSASSYAKFHFRFQWWVMHRCGADSRHLATQGNVSHALIDRPSAGTRGNAILAFANITILNNWEIQWVINPMITKSDIFLTRTVIIWGQEVIHFLAGLIVKD